MPTYEYQCLKCGHKFERFQSMTDQPVKRCPECRCKVRRLLGVGAGIIFKGSGFYETDYKRKNSGGAGKTESTKSSVKTENKKSDDSKKATGASKTE